MWEEIGERISTLRRERKLTQEQFGNLTGRTPTIIRIDGKAFHSFTRGFQKPLDPVFAQSIWEAAKYLCENIMGCKTAYVQSDEINLLLTDYESTTTQSWFDKNILKMTSVSASMATMAFNRAFAQIADEYLSVYTPDFQSDPSIKPELKKVYERYKKVTGTAMFDARIFSLPKEEVCNCFVWRQQDATRNAIEAAGQVHFSQKRLHGKNNSIIQEMLFQEKEINFNDYPVYQKRGVCVIKEKYDKDGTPRSRWVIDKEIPIFTQDREYIEKYI